MLKEALAERMTATRISPSQLRVDKPRISSETAASYGQAGRSELLLQLSKVGDVAYLPAGEALRGVRHLRYDERIAEPGTISVCRCGNYPKTAHKPARHGWLKFVDATAADCLSGRISNA